MSSDNQASVFVERANTLIQTKVILTDKAISNLLKCVVANPILLDTVKNSLKEIAYATEFSRCKSTITLPNGNTASRLKLPQTDERILAFVVCLLTEFDTGRRNMIEFLQEYYYSDDPNASYRQFATQILKPFKKAVERMLGSSETSSDTVSEIDEQKAENSFLCEHIYIKNTVLSDLIQQLSSISVKLETEMFYSQQDKADVNYIVNAMKTALESKNPRLIRIIWIGCKNTLKQYRSVESFVKKMTSLLIENNLL